MDNIKRTLSKSKMILRIAAFAGLFQTGCASLPLFQKAQDSPSIQLQSSSLIKKLTSNEKDFWKDFIKDYSGKSSAAKKILRELAQQKAEIEYFDQEQDKDNLFWAGKSDENTLSLNRKIQEKGVSLPNTFFHEAEHVVHLKRARQTGINAASFASLDDVYIYATLLEALAYRKAALCCAEYKRTPKAIQLANSVFIERLKTDKKPIEERFSYEKSAFVMSALETNSLPNHVHFKNNPDWDKIVSLLSRGEVRKVPVLPQPTLLFLGDCLSSELKKHPNAKTLKELDISCVLAHKNILQKQEIEIKRSISNFLIQTYDICYKSDHSLSLETRNKLLYYVGWPDAEQKRKIERKEAAFVDIRDMNLSKFKTAELFEAAINLIQSPEIQSYHNSKINHYGKILTFEKMILVPPQSQQKVKTRRQGR